MEFAKWVLSDLSTFANSPSGEFGNLALWIFWTFFEIWGIGEMGKSGIGEFWDLVRLWNGSTIF